MRDRQLAAAPQLLLERGRRALDLADEERVQAHHARFEH